MAANLDRWYAAHILFVLGLLFAVPSIIALAQLVGARRPGWAQAGGALAFVGLIGVTPVIAWEFVIWETAKPARDPGEMVALLERISTTTTVVVALAGTIAIFAGSAAIGWRLLGETRAPTAVPAKSGV